MASENTDKKESENRGVRVYPKHLPDDIHAIVKKEKNEHEAKIKKSFSWEATFYKIIRQCKSI